MSKFSEEIKKAIEESEMTLLSLSDASGLSVDHISKMLFIRRVYLSVTSMIFVQETVTRSKQLLCSKK